MRTAPLILPVAFVLLASCSRPTPTSAYVDPALLTLVPADTVTLSGVRLEKIRDTPAYRKYVANQPFPGLDNFVQRTGVDPRKDVYELLFATNPSGTPLLLIRGKFPADMGRIPDVQRRGIPVTPYKGLSLLGDERGAITFINTAVAAVAPAPLLRSLIDNRASTAGPTPALREGIKSLPYNAQLWTVSLPGRNPLPFEVPQDGNLANLNRVLTSLDGLTAWADLRQGVHAVADAHSITEADAVKLRDILKGLVGFGRLSVPDNQPELLKVYDSIQVEQTGPKVHAEAQIPENLVEEIAAKLPGPAAQAK